MKLQNTPNCCLNRLPRRKWQKLAPHICLSADSDIVVSYGFSDFTIASCGSTVYVSCMLRWHYTAIYIERFVFVCIIIIIIIKNKSHCVFVWDSVYLVFVEICNYLVNTALIVDCSDKISLINWWHFRYYSSGLIEFLKFQPFDWKIFGCRLNVESPSGCITEVLWIFINREFIIILKPQTERFTSSSHF